MQPPSNGMQGGELGEQFQPPVHSEVKVGPSIQGMAMATEVRGPRFLPLGKVGGSSNETWMRLWRCRPMRVLRKVFMEQGGLRSTSTEVVMEEEVFQFRASHESIKTGLRSLRRPNEVSVGKRWPVERRS